MKPPFDSGEPEDARFIMCETHHMARRAYLGRLRNYWERLSWNNPPEGPVESKFFYDHGKPAWVDVGAASMMRQQEEEEEEEEEPRGGRSPKRRRSPKREREEEKEKEEKPAPKRGRDEERAKLAELRALFVRARAACPLLPENTPSEAIERALNETGVALVSVRASAAAIKADVGRLVAETFPLLSPEVREQLAQGSFAEASAEWTDRKVSETGMALRSNRMPQTIPMWKDTRPVFTDPTLKTVHVRNPMLAQAPFAVWEHLPRSLQPSNWFRAPRVLCSEDGIKFSNNVLYDPTKIHYDGQRERVQVVFSTDTGPVRLFAVPGSGTPEAQALICDILGIQALGEGFSTHAAAFRAHPKLATLMHEFGLSVGGPGLLAFRTRVWHYEAEEAPPDGSGLATVAQPFSWERSRDATARSDVFRVYCGVVALEDTPRMRDRLLRHAFLRENNWPMEAFANPNKAKGAPIFVAEKSTQDGTRSDYAELVPEWRALQRRTDGARRFLLQLP